MHPKLLSNWKVTLLPHIGGGTIETAKVSIVSFSVRQWLIWRQKFEEIAMNNIENFFLGDGKPLTPINKVAEL